MKVAIKALIRGISRMIAPPKSLTDLPVLPVSELFGLDRGTPIDRYYIERFLKQNAHLIKGRAVEIAENKYTKQFGKGVEKSEILHVDSQFEGATIIADLTDIDSVPENIADVFICTQTLNFIYDVKKAISGIHKILKPQGKALITVSGLSQISRFDMDRWGDYWRFTDKSLKLLLSESFGEDNVEIQIFGNAYSATLFLQGIAVEEADVEKIKAQSADYQVTLGAVVTKK
jgi:SAM-dependent methyltransferase